jgi:hypothetical protein
VGVGVLPAAAGMAAVQEPGRAWVRGAAAVAAGGACVSGKVRLAVCIDWTGEEPGLLFLFVVDLAMNCV